MLERKKHINDQTEHPLAEEQQQYELASPTKRLHGSMGNFHDNEVNEDAIPEPDEYGYQFFMGQSSLDGSFDDDGSYHFDEGGSDYHFDGNLDEESDELLEKYFYNTDDDGAEDPAFIADYEDEEAIADNAPAFVVHDIHRPLMLPTFQDLAYLPAETFEFLIPKSDDGELRLIIRYDDAGGGGGGDDDDSEHGHHRRGLFLHGFKANCKAEDLNLLMIGDEILAVNGVSIAGQHLFFLVSLLEEFVADDSVMIKVRRRYDVDHDGKNMRTNLTQMYGTSKKLTREQVLEHEENEDLLMEDMDDLSQAELDEDDEDHLEVEPPDPMFSTTQSQASAGGIMPKSLFQDTLGSRKASPKKRAAVPLDAEAADEYEYIVPKSIDGTLRLIILKAEASPRPTITGNAPHAPDDDRIPGGLYIHGFKANSKAEESGLLKMGDELIAVNGVDVRGQELHDVADVLEEYLLDDFIMVKIRRRRVMITSLRPDSTFHQSVKQQWQETQIKSEIVVHDWNEFDDDEENEEQVRHLLDFGKPLPSSKPGTAAAANRMQSDPGVYSTPGKRSTSSRGASARRLSSTPLLRLQTPNSIKAMRKLPTDILQLTIPKTNGELCLYIRHEDEGIDGGHGLFIHGFKQIAVYDEDMSMDEDPDDVVYERSLVEQQGLIMIGDELITINGTDVEGKYLEDVVAALRNHTGENIPVCIKRRPLQM